MLQVAQLASSIFLLTHSLKNYQTASDIIEKYQNKTVYDLRADLSNNAKYVVSFILKFLYNILYIF